MDGARRATLKAGPDRREIAMNAEDVRREMTGDVVALLVDGHRDFLRFLERRGVGRTVAEDILQEAFVRSLERVEELRGEETVVAWFYRVLRNAVIDHYRRQGASGRALDELARELEEDAVPSPDMRDAICQCVGRLVGTLKPEYAQALQRVELEGVPVKQFAQEAGISANNAAVRVHRAREALRKQVKSCCGSCAEHGCVDCGCRQQG
jgi:RNA polymerase sigma-70 factor (ECF subfamily)